MLHSLAVALRQRGERGQTMAEYAVVLGVITLVIVAAIALLSGNITQAISNVSTRV